LNFLPSAYRLLLSIYRRPTANPKLQLDRWLRRESGSDKSEITRTVYGVLRKESTLARLIGSLATGRPPKRGSATDVLLKIGIYLLLFSESYPEYTVVNEIVALAPAHGKPLINALLRRAASGKEALRADISLNPDLSMRFSISPLLIDRLSRISDQLADDLAYLDREPVFHLRLNPRKSDWDSLCRLLQAEAEVVRELPALQSFAVVHPARGVRSHISQGLFYFQNTGSQAVALVAAQNARQQVLDAVAAPGSKSFTIRLLRPELRLMASDVHPGRLALMRQAMTRLDLTDIELFVGDLRRPAFRPSRFDLVLVDAPCTASGTLRKNPDLKTRIDLDSIREKTALQREMLQALIALVQPHPSPWILYAVCSFIAEETEELLAEMNERRAIEPRDLQPLLAAHGFRLRQGKFGCYLLPETGLDNDLFYLSLFRI